MTWKQHVAHVQGDRPRTVGERGAGHLDQRIGFRFLGHTPGELSRGALHHRAEVHELSLDLAEDPQRISTFGGRKMQAGRVATEHTHGHAPACRIEQVIRRQVYEVEGSLCGTGGRIHDVVHPR